MAARARIAHQKTPGKDVRGRTDWIVEDLFGRHPPAGPEDQPPVEVMAYGSRGLGYPEVDDPRPGQRHDHVGRFEVTVDDPGVVDGCQRRCHPDRGTGQGRGGQRAVLHDHPVQPPALDVLGDEVRRVGVRVRVKHRSRAERRDPPGRRNLMAEPFPEVVVGREVRPDQLDRNVAARRVPTEIDRAHAAGGEATVQHIPADRYRVVRL